MLKRDSRNSRFNTQLRDLGYGQKVGLNATKLAAAVQQVDRDFDLVMGGFLPTSPCDVGRHFEY